MTNFSTLKVCLLLSVSLLCFSKRLNAQSGASHLQYFFHPTTTAGIGASAAIPHWDSKPIVQAAGIDPTKPVKEIIDEARHAADEAIDHATNSGSYMIDLTANQLRVLVGQAEQAINGQTDKVFKKLDQETQAIFSKMDELTEKIERGESVMVSMMDDASIDINNLIPGVGDKLMFKRIKGFVHLYNADSQANYPIDISGTNFGLGESSSKVRIGKFSIDGTDFLPHITSSASSQHDRTIFIPGRWLNPYFQSRKMVKVKIGIEMDKKDKRSFIISWNKKRKIVDSFYLYLIPNYAGTYTFTAIKEVRGWQHCGDRAQTVTGGDNHCDPGSFWHHHDCSPEAWRGNPYSVEIRCIGVHEPPQIGDQRFSDIEFRQIAGPGGFDNEIRSWIDENGAHAQGSYFGRTHPTTYRLSCNLNCYMVLSTDTLRQTVDFYYGDNIVINFPKETRLILVSGKNLITGRKINYRIDEHNDVFQLISTQEIGEKTVCDLRICSPNPMANSAGK